MQNGRKDYEKYLYSAHLELISVLFYFSVTESLEVIVPAGTPNPFCSSLPSRIPTGFAMKKSNRPAVVMSNDFICVIQKLNE